jgi:hypothetical protein
VLAVLALPRSSELFLVLLRSAVLLMSISGAVKQSYVLPSAAAGGGGGGATFASASGAPVASSSRSAAAAAAAAAAQPELTCMCLSPACKWLYAAAEDGKIYAWALASGALAMEPGAAAHSKAAKGLAMHPHRPLLASWGEEGLVKSWKP